MNPEVGTSLKIKIASHYNSNYNFCHINLTSETGPCAKSWAPGCVNGGQGICVSRQPVDAEHKRISRRKIEALLSTAQRIVGICK